MPIHKWLFCPIAALYEKFYPRNINDMPPDKFFARLDLDRNPLFLDGHEVTFQMSGNPVLPCVLQCFRRAFPGHPATASSHV
jgi:hypothetical protein